jgi:hypothetical protein
LDWFTPDHGLGFTDGGLEMVATDVVELDAVVVEVVEDGQAELVTLAVIRLRNSATEI